jgi:hypothetical protein
MTNNPLLQKYDELYGKQEEPKPSSPPPRYSGDPWAIRQFENLLEELKSGRAVLVDSKEEQKYQYYNAREDFKRFSAVSSSPPEMMPLRIDEGSQITLTIFRKYR